MSRSRTVYSIARCRNTIIDERRACCFQTTVAWLASSVADRGLGFIGIRGSGWGLEREGCPGWGRRPNTDAAQVEVRDSSPSGTPARNSSPSGTPRARLKSVWSGLAWVAHLDLGDQTDLGCGHGCPLRPNSKFWKKLGCALGLANDSFWSVRSGQYPHFGRFGLVSTCISIGLVWWIPTFRGLFGLATTHILVSLVRPIPTFWSVWSGQCPHSSARAPA